VGTHNICSSDTIFFSQLASAKIVHLVNYLYWTAALAEDFDMAEDISPLEPFKTYDLPTPYDSFGAGAVLMEVLVP
nr:hypothetical protein [Nostocaceae cyanobacterium]